MTTDEGVAGRASVLAVLRRTLRVALLQPRVGLPRKYWYRVALVVVYTVWLTYMVATNLWGLFSEHWPISITMSLGFLRCRGDSCGRGGRSFPVFTKTPSIAPPTAAAFGLLIQSVGMTMATVVILARRVPILPRVILWVSMGVVGQLVGIYAVSLASPYSKILFTFVATVLGVALVISRWVLKWQPYKRLPRWSRKSQLVFLEVGLFGACSQPTQVRHRHADLHRPDVGCRH